MHALGYAYIISSGYTEMMILILNYTIMYLSHILQSKRKYKISNDSDFCIKTLILDECDFIFIDIPILDSI